MFLLTHLSLLLIYSVVLFVSNKVYKLYKLNKQLKNNDMLLIINFNQNNLNLKIESGELNKPITSYGIILYTYEKNNGNINKLDKIFTDIIMSKFNFIKKQFEITE